MQAQTHNAPPRVAALHDLSCFGRCALTVVIPTLSVMGYQVVPIPTALLSTHTGGFTDLHFRDLTEDMEAITRHFHALDLRFRSIYTGFLGSEAQIDSVQRLLAEFGRSADIQNTYRSDSKQTSEYLTLFQKTGPAHSVRTILCRVASLLKASLSEPQRGHS